MHPFRFVLLCAITSAALSSHAQGGKTYCNPLDLDYQYNFEQRERNKDLLPFPVKSQRLGMGQTPHLLSQTGRQAPATMRS